ncbi:NADP-dependent oxidoreductase [Alicyclobacillus acidiphilus]|uniref:NADP-dependent oxidoreductase n=1 Tax=Alicyclobacillus acidiphilus TaxID=182455 RepID=UPI00082EC5D8|nr:NADP-dependent oxidoreductase [Alicyclobacillus acidiphilus]
MSSQTARRIVLAKRPTGTPTTDCFREETYTLPEVHDGEALLRTLYISVDPYMRGRMNAGKSYVPPFQLDEPILGGAICEVVESKAPDLKPGDLVLSQTGWQTHAVSPAANLRKLEGLPGPVTMALGILGATGLTAYFGLFDICHPTSGETVVVSGAAGAVGTVVGQLAKLVGCRVVGIAGSDKKVQYLTQTLGFDAAINYHTDDIAAALADACPSGIDIYFDNVGGPVSDAVLSQINDGARIAVCGQISLYNLDKPDVGPRVMPMILTHRALMKGFIIGDYRDRFPEGVRALATWIAEGRLKWEETIVEGFDHTVDAFLGLFRGDNLGKQLVKL